MADLLRDLEALRDEWDAWEPSDPNDDGEQSIHGFLGGAVARLDALLSAHAAGPDLRETVLANYEEVGDFVSAPGGSQCVDGKWYAPKWGCDTLEHVLAALASPAAPKAEGWLGLWECVTCGYQYTSREASERYYVCTVRHKKGDDCTLRPFERRFCMSTPWRPANGREVDGFILRWCAWCSRREETEDGCSVLNAALDGDVPGYPAEWVSTDGVPSCTSFEEVGK